ncbi:MAG: DUF2642 domain-containing protein [Candidatus Pristimantibacillus sp.]
MKEFNQFLGKKIVVELSGKRLLKGKLLDTGMDIMVITDKQQFYYIPLAHVKNIKANLLASNDSSDSAIELPVEYQVDHLSTRQILNQARGLFAEVYVNGNKSIHGYVNGVLNDYFVIHSPIYKSIFISLHHFKWLIPYPPSHIPYSLQHQSLSVKPINSSLPATFEEQCKKAEGSIVVYDLGSECNKVGRINQVSNGIIDLVNAEGNSTIWNIRHLKTMYIP